MGKAGFGSKDAVAVSLGIEAGNVEIVSAVSKIHQYPPNKTTGQQSEPFGCVQLGFQQFDQNWNKLDEEPVKMEFGWGGGFGKAHKFHPGLVDSADDDDVQDQGEEVDVEGNCIYAIEDGSRLNTKCKWIIFTTSMEKFGFKPEVLGNGYLPDLIGTRGHVHTVKAERMAGSTAKNDPTNLLFDSITVFPYDKKSKKGPVPAPAAGKPAVKAAAGKSAPAPAPAGSDDDATALEMFNLVKGDLAGSELEVKSLKSKVTAKLMRNKIPTGRHKAVLAIISNPDWLISLSEQDDAGFAFDADTSVLMFAAAEED